MGQERLLDVRRRRSSDEFERSRDELMEALRERGVDSRTFFCPMNLQPALQRTSGYRPVACPVAERLWERGLYLPSSPGLAAAEQEQVIEALVSAAGL